MSNDLSEAENEFEKVAELVNKFGSQAQQIQSSERALQSAQKVFETKAEEMIVSAYKQLHDAKTWYEQTTDDIGALCSELTESFEPLKNAFDEEKFKVLCAKLSELARILEECSSLKKAIADLKSDIVEEVYKKISADISVIKAQQEENRAYLEAQFSGILAKFDNSNPA